MGLGRVLRRVSATEPSAAMERARRIVRRNIDLLVWLSRSEGCSLSCSSHLICQALLVYLAFIYQSRCMLHMFVFLCGVVIRLDRDRQARSRYWITRTTL